MAPKRTNTFAAPVLDRAGHLRKDDAWLEKAIAGSDSQILLMQDGKPLCFGAAGDGGPRDLAWLGAQTLAVVPADTIRVFLGLDGSGRPHFALGLGDTFNMSTTPLDGLGTFEDLRGIAGQLSEEDLSSIGTARSLFEWHRRHGFCANCGAATEIKEAGWKRQCPSCGAEHFPRVDPVAIMLAVCGDHCLLGTGHGFPPQMVSCLAGFIEPGETFEDGARRELLEEAGVEGGAVRYLFGQPWPFPSSLMLGMIIECDRMDLTVDTAELQAAYWLSKDDVKAMLRQDHPDYFCPPPFAIAHQIMRVWAET